MPDTLISVILPVKNGMPYLEESIDSILNQTERRFKLIVVDDHSTDGSADYVKSQTDKRIILVKNSGSGLVDALNTGIKLANTEYIARMDADDISYPQRFEEQLKLFQTNEKAVLIGTWYKYFSDSLNKISIPNKLPADNSAILSKMRNAENAICHPTIMMRKKLIDSIGLYDKGAFPAEDYDLFFRASKAGDLLNVPQVLLKYRITKKSIFSKNAVKSSSAYIQIRNKYISAKKNGQFLTPYSMAIYRKGLYYYLKNKKMTSAAFLVLSFLLVPKRGLNFIRRNFFNTSR